MEFEYLLAIAALLLLLSILASKAFNRLGVPALLVFLVIGMLAGSDGPGGIYFDNAHLAQALGTVALALILFAGGLETDGASIRPVLWSGLVLSTLGLLLTALLVGGFARAVLGFSWLEGMLLGAIVSSTDAAAVFSVLKSRGSKLSGRIEPLLELESGSNDAMAVFLTLGLIRLLANPAASVLGLAPMFLWQMALGAGAGYGMGKAMIFLINRLRLEYEGLYPVLSLSLALLTYGATAALGGNGFLAVYLAGIVLGNSRFIHKRSLLRFHDGLAWLMQIIMFLTLGLLVFPSHLVPVMGVSLAVALFLIFVARPASVFVSLLFANMNVREKAMISWVGLRGAVPIILATFPLLAGVPKAEVFFNVVFFIVLTSGLLQGTSIPLIARWLKVGTPSPARPPSPLELVATGDAKSAPVEIHIPPDAAIVGKRIVEARFPPGVLIALISKRGEMVVPSGNTLLEAGDTLLVLADQAALGETRMLVEAR